MKADELKAKLHSYIENSSDEELEDMLLFCEDEIEYKKTGQRYQWWEDEEFVKELDRRTEELESGKVKGIPAEEVLRNARERLKKSRDQ